MNNWIIGADIDELITNTVTNSFENSLYDSEMDLVGDTFHNELCALVYDPLFFSMPFNLRTSLDLLGGLMGRCIDMTRLSKEYRRLVSAFFDRLMLHASSESDHCEYAKSIYLGIAEALVIDGGLGGRGKDTWATDTFAFTFSNNRFKTEDYDTYYGYMFGVSA